MTAGAGFDYLPLVSQIAGAQEIVPSRTFYGQVSSVDAANGQVTLVPSQATSAANSITARYICTFPPRPGSTVRCTTDGVDVICWGPLAPEAGPQCMLYRNAELNHTASGSWRAAGMDTARYDPWGMRSGTDIVIPARGYYMLRSQITFPSTGGGQRGAGIYVNGALASQTAGYTPSNTSSQFAEAILPLNAGDTVQAWGLQSSGGTLAYGVGTPNCTLSAFWHSHMIPATSTGPEMILNNGFEQGYAVGWMHFWGFWGVPTTSGDTASSHSGTNALVQTDPVGGTAWMSSDSDPFMVTPGATYDLSVWVKATTARTLGASDGAIFGIISAPTPGEATYFQPRAVGQLPGAFSLTTGYLNQATAVTVPLGHQYARVVLRGASAVANSIYWDDVSMRQRATL